jgi:hypothetical protein
MAMLLVCAWPCQAEEAAAGEKAPPSIAAVKVTEPAVLDGKLDDACWQQATHVAGFWRTEHDAPEFERTEAWLCYTPKAIYVAFRCYDSEPAAIKATQKKRQGSFGDDDWVGFWLDVAPDSLGFFYSFRVNPAGTQFDSTPGGTSEKVEWRGDWRAAAAVDAEGWSAEMEIPFSILRYPDGQTCFRFDVSRQLARRQDYAIWPAGFARTFDADACARWTGIATPPVPFRSCFMPYALSVFSEDDEDRDPLTAGLDYKGTFPNGVVGMAAINPDFRNLEDVVETIDFTFVERYLPEYRPFFQEGRGFFPPSSVFYSRRIEDFDWGLKSFGRVGTNGFGVLDTYRRGGENHLAWEFDHYLGTTGMVALFGAAPRLPDEPRNVSGGVYADRSWPFDGGSKFASVSWMSSRTAGEGGDDQVIEFNTGQSRTQGLGYHLGYFAIGPDFTAQDGYVPETGVRSFHGQLEENRSYDQGALQSRFLYLYGSLGESEKGKRRSLGLGHDWHWRNGVSLFVGGDDGERDGLATSGYWLGGIWNRNDRYRTGRWSYQWGERLGFPSRYLSLSKCFRISQRWSGELRLERNNSAELDEDDESVIIPPETTRQAVLTATYDISDERSLSGRMVIYGGNTNFYLAYRQRVRKGTDVLIVVGDPNADEWVSRLAVKAMWCY